MSPIVHHLAAMGWGWVLAFALLDGLAVACAVVAMASRRHALVLRAALVSGTVMIAVIGVAVLAVVVGLDTAYAATELDADPSQKARRLAEGISTAMNAVPVGAIAAIVASLPFAVCTVRLVKLAPRARSPEEPAAPEGGPAPRQ